MRSVARLPRALSAALCVAFSFSAALHAATPAEYRQKVGVYVWGRVASGLAGAAADVKRLGADQVVRVFIGPGAQWDPPGQPANEPLDVKLQRLDYREFIDSFPVVMITAYDVASFARYKEAPLDQETLTRTRDEFRRFTVELSRHPGRRILSNWEFENDCLPDNWAGCIEYYQARLDGIRQGRSEANALGYPGEILTAFEFTILPDFGGKRSGLVDAAPQLKGVDMLSYSAWWSIGHDLTAGLMHESFKEALRRIRATADERGLARRIIIGEFGEYWDAHPNAERLKAVADACIYRGVEYLFNWVLYDQPGQKDEWGRDASHFGKYRLDGALTPQGEAFRRWFIPAAPRGAPTHDHPAAKAPVRKANP